MLHWTVLHPDCVGCRTALYLLYCDFVSYMHSMRVLVCAKTVSLYFASPCVSCLVLCLQYYIFLHYRASLAYRGTDYIYDIWRQGCCELNHTLEITAKAQFGQVNPQVDDWMHYMEYLDYYFVANDITNAERSMLFFCLFLA